MTGEYGIDGVYLGVPARIGAGGVTEIVELDLTSAERKALSGAADEVRRKVGELEQLDLA